MHTHSFHFYTHTRHAHTHTHAHTLYISSHFHTHTHTAAAHAKLGDQQQSKASENVWNSGLLGSGGGFSARWPRPAWQNTSVSSYLAKIKGRVNAR